MTDWLRSRRAGNGIEANAFENLHLKLHLTSNTGAVMGRCVALNERSKKWLEPL